MEKIICQTCCKNKTALRCDACELPTCKKCAQFIDEDSFENLSLMPEDLQNKTFCNPCYEQGVAERVEQCRFLFEKAKAVDVYNITQTKETRLMKRSQEKLKVENCLDEREALMHLAFLAAQKGFDTIVDVSLVSKKTGEGKRYKKVVWSGSATPVGPNKKH